MTNINHVCRNKIIKKANTILVHLIKMAGFLFAYWPHLTHYSACCFVLFLFGFFGVVYFVCLFVFCFVLFFVVVFLLLLSLFGLVGR